ncbi:hypothetical protein AgCh_023716 [Apium graveolens]
MEESYIVKKLLRVVPTRFLRISSTLEQLGGMENMTVEETVGSLKAHEERIKGKTEMKETQLMLIEDEWTKHEGEEKKLPLTREEWLKRNNDDISKHKSYGNFNKCNIKCYNCNIYGHFASEYKKPGKNKGMHEVEANMAILDDDEPALLLAKHDKEAPKLLLSEDKILSTQLPNNGDYVGESNVWYLDNGASNHMTGFRSKFSKLDESIFGQVRFGDGSKVEIKGKGIVMMLCKNGEEKKLHEECIMPKTNEISRQWHAHHGHVNYQVLALISKHYMVKGIPRIIKPNVVCDKCLMAKQTGKTFPNKAKYSAKKELELIHGDLCGPISPPTLSGYSYFFLLIDDFSRFMWVYFLKGKDEAIQAFKKFRTLVENGSKRRIKVFKTDRGATFNFYEFKEFCEGA